MLFYVKLLQILIVYKQKSSETFKIWTHICHSGSFMFLLFVENPNLALNNERERSPFYGPFFYDHVSDFFLLKTWFTMVVPVFF